MRYLVTRTFFIGSIAFLSMALVGCRGGFMGSPLIPSGTSSAIATSAPTTSTPPTTAPTLAPIVTGIPTPTTAPTGTPTAIPTAATTPNLPVQTQMSFYSYIDNGNSTTITYPLSQNYPTVHASAGGTGTYSDPLTAASSIAAFPVGAKLYVFALQKYVVMESSCSGCDQDWTLSGKRDLQIWTGGDATTLPAAMTACESSLLGGVTKNTMGMLVLRNPPNSLSVDTTPLFQPVTSSASSTYSWVCYY